MTEIGNNTHTHTLAEYLLTCDWEPALGLGGLTADQGSLSSNLAKKILISLNYEIL